MTVGSQAPGRLAVHVENLRVTYRVRAGGGATTLRSLVERRPRRAGDVAALKGVSFEVNEGEALGIIGRNGSGKTTLTRAMAGLVRSDTGAVYAKSHPVLLGVGAALQPELSGRRNILLGGMALGLSAKEARDGLDDVVAFSGLDDAIDRPLRTYSAGMSARLRFAIAVNISPQILIVDEMLGVGDMEFRERSDARMRKLLASAGTVILVSHSLASISQLCPRSLWLDRGEVRMDGPTSEVVTAYREAINTARTEP
jgi:teichoic acid transport system ATP-binding protein